MPAVDPDAIPRRSFGTAFRGYDQLEVRGYLSELAEEVRLLRNRESELFGQLAEAERRAAQAENLDEARLTEILGTETAKVIMAAKDAAATIRAKAEESAARLLRDAQDEIARVRSEADAEVQRRLAAAERAGGEVRAGAELIRTEAAAAAEASVEAAREEGQRMVAEAQAVRERVLHDLTRRRKTVRHQIEQLRAGRERLMRAYEVVQRTLDEATHELRVVIPEARMAAEAAPARDDDAGDEAGGTVEPVGETPSEAAAEPKVESAETTGQAAPEPGPEPAVSTEAGVEAESASEPETETSEPETETSEAESEPERLAEPEPQWAVETADDAGEREPATVLEAEGPEVITPPRRRRRRRGRDDLPEGELVALRAPDPVEEVRLVESPADADAETDAETVAEVAADAAPVSEVEGLFARLRADREAEVERARAVLAEPSTEDEPGPRGNGRDAATTDLLERRDAATEEVENRLGRHLKRVLSDEQNEVLDLVRRLGFTTIADLLPPEHAQRYADAARADLEAAAAAGVAFLVRGDRDGIARHVAVDVADLAGELAGAIVGVVHERVERAFAEADGDAAELTERVRACYREWKTQRISDTARHYVLAAFTRGLFEAQPQGARLCWLVDDGGAPCPDAEDNSLAGAVAKGEAFPTGHAYPPAHPGCRCLILPAPE